MSDLPKPAVPYDWPAIKTQFVVSDPPVTLPQFSEITGIPISTLETHSSEEQWMIARGEYQGAAATKTRALAIERTAGERVSSLDVMETALELASKQLVLMMEGLNSKNWQKEDPISIAKASASIMTAADKVARCKELLTGGVDSRAQIDLATLLADLRSE